MGCHSYCAFKVIPGTVVPCFSYHSLFTTRQDTGQEQTLTDSFHAPFSWGIQECAAIHYLAKKVKEWLFNLLISEYHQWDGHIWNHNTCCAWYHRWNGDKNQLKRLQSVGEESLVLKLTCCTGERRNKETIRRMQKHMSKYGKTISRGTFKVDRNRMKPYLFIQRKHRHLIIINLLSDTVKLFPCHGGVWKVLLSS